jgi:hypothetical protein
MPSQIKAKSTTFVVLQLAAAAAEFFGDKPSAEKTLRGYAEFVHEDFPDVACVGAALRNTQQPASNPSGRDGYEMLIALTGVSDDNKDELREIADEASSASIGDPYKMLDVLQRLLSDAPDASDLNTAMEAMTSATGDSAVWSTYKQGAPALAGFGPGTWADLRAPQGVTTSLGAAAAA